MSLLSTLAKVAVGVAVAKGVSSMAAGASQKSAGGAGTGSVFGDLLSPGSSRQAGGLGQVLSGRGDTQGGLGGLLESLSQASRPGDDAPVAAPSGGSLGDMLNQSLDHFGEPVTAPEPEQEATAKILLRAMLQAAKSDGRIDAEEKKELLDKLGDISKDDMAFVNEQLSAPVDVAALASDVPRGAESQVYMMSLLAIDLDKKAEAQYLHDLAQALNIEPRVANAIHVRMGEPKIYN